MVTPSRAALVRLVLVVAVVAAGVGVVAAHGSFNVSLLVQEQAGPDVPERFQFNVTTGGADEVPERFQSERIAVNYTVFADGDPIDAGEFELAFLDSRVVEGTHTFSEPGFHEVAVNATYSLGGGEWTRQARSTRLIEVVEPGTRAAAEECSAHAGGDLLPPYPVGCYLAHLGIGGLVPGLVASPVVVIAGLALLIGGGLGTVRLLGIELG